MKLRIGILEDKEKHYRDAKRTILFQCNSNMNFDCDVEFINIYELHEIKSQNDVKQIYEKLLDEVNQDIYDCLIIDNELIENNKKVKGLLINTKLHQAITEFPIILLTSYSDEISSCPMIEDIDLDKVYAKEKFFLFREEYARDKVKALLTNAIRYRNNIKFLESQYEALNPSNDQNNLNELINIEAELSKYKSGNINVNNFEKILIKLNVTLDNLDKVNKMKDIDGYEED